MGRNHMADTDGCLTVCRHVLDGFKQGYIVCQVDTDQCKLDVATCLSCIVEILDGKPGKVGTYKKVTREHAAELGVVIVETSDQTAPVRWRPRSETLN